MKLLCEPMAVGIDQESCGGGNTNSRYERHGSVELEASFDPLNGELAVKHSFQ